MRPLILSAILIASLVFPALNSAQSTSLEDQAYELNREGMVEMSQAAFEKAIEAFDKAAALAKDYEILGRPLTYTPVFMAAWAGEKIGRVKEACGAYRRFLQIAPPGRVEATKAEHAKEYLKLHCGS